MISFTGNEKVDTLLHSIVEGCKTLVNHNDITEENISLLIAELKQADESIYSTLDMVDDPID